MNIEHKPVLEFPDDIWVSIINNLLGTHKSEGWLLNIIGVCKGLNFLINLRIKPNYIPFDIFIPLKNIIGKWSVYEFDIPSNIKPRKYLKHLHNNCELYIGCYLHSPTRSFEESSTSGKGLLYLFVDIHGSFCPYNINHEGASLDEICSDLKLKYKSLKRCFPLGKELKYYIKFLLTPLISTFFYKDRKNGDYDTTFNFRCCLDNISKTNRYSSDSSSSSDSSFDFEQYFSDDCSY